MLFSLSKRFMRDASRVNNYWRKEDEAVNGWILPQDNDDFMRIVQKIKAAQNASAFINSSDAGLWCLARFLCFFFFCRRGCFIYCACG
jgi:hypothetical protein